MRRLLSVGAVSALAALALVAGIAGCGGSSSTSTSVDPNAQEVSPPGDIPDNQAFVHYRVPGSSFQVDVPEGWSRSTTGGAVTFTDKLNSIRLETKTASAAPTVADGQAEINALASSVPGFQPGDVSIVQRNSGPALLLTYKGEGPKDPVTGKAVIDAFERYEFVKNGTQLTVTLSGPDGADNVDPWRIVTDSVQTV